MVDLAVDVGTVNARAIELTFSGTAAAAVEVVLLQVRRGAGAWVPRLELVPDPFWKLDGKIRDLPLPGLLGDLIGAAGDAIHTLLTDLRMLAGTPKFSWRNGALVLGDLSIDCTLDGQPLRLFGGELAFNTELVLSPVGNEPPSITVELQRDVALSEGEAKPFTIVLANHSRFRISLDAARPFIAVTAPGAVPPASVYVPGIALAKISDAGEVGRRFVLDVFGDDPDGKQPRAPGEPPHVLRFAPGATELYARLRPRGLDLGKILQGGATVEGALAVIGGQFHLEARAAAHLPYFQGADGKLFVAASSRGWKGAGGAGDGGVSLRVHFDVQLDNWHDPSGVLAVEHPAVFVDVAWGQKDGKWQWLVGGGVSGKLIFHPPKSFLGAAGEWLAKLFTSIEVEFDHLALDKLADVGTPPADPHAPNPPPVKLDLKLARPIHFSLWDLLSVSLDEIWLHLRGISIGGDFDLNLEILEFGGRLPSLGMTLENGTVALGVDGGSTEFHVHGGLSIPAGVQATLDLARIDDGSEQALEGAGTVSLPGFPPVRIAARFGRFREHDGPWQPLFFIFAEADIPIVLFPGIVLREMGIGFGLNQALAEFDAVLRDGVEAVLARGAALPEPASPNGWVLSPGKSTIALRTHLAPTPEDGGGKAPQIYVADAIIGIDSEASVVFFSGVWLFTSLVDCDKPNFRKNPFIKGILALYPKHQRIEGKFMTCPEPAMSIGDEIPILSAILRYVQAEVSFLVTPDIFRLRLGPVRADGEMLGIQVHGRLLFAVEASGRGVVALSQLELSASFSETIGFTLGPISAGIELWAGFGFGCSYAGGITDGTIWFYGSAWVHVAAGLRIWLDVTFSITIHFFGTHTITFSIHFSTQLSIAFDASVRAAIGTMGAGLRGSGTLDLNVFGFHLRPTLDFTLGSGGAVDYAQGNFQRLLGDG